jgi:hypothetical protein
MAMATSSGNLRAGKAIAAQGGFTAKLAAGLVILGRAAGLAFGGLRAGDAAPPRVVPAAPVIGMGTSDPRERQRFLEQNQLPGDILSTTEPADPRIMPR